jgi:FdhD protein
LSSEGVVPTVFRQLTGDGWSAIDSGVPEEAPLSIYVNGLELATFMCTPVDQEALALGFLANEGLIDGRDEVRVLHICGQGTCVDVWLSHAIQRPSRSIITSGCGGGLTFDDLSGQFEPLNSDMQVTPAQIQNLTRHLQGAGSMYRSVRGTHTSALSDGARLLLVAEDVGRHNTLDKLRGMALMEGLDTRDLILLSSGRISSEMLTKAAKMKVPVIVSRTSPTSLSVALAQAWGITLIGYARPSRLNVYAGEERLRVEVGDGGENREP